MKTILIFVLALVLGVSSVVADCIVEDNFNSYANGSVVGQGGWESYLNGENFLVQNVTTFEGSRAIYTSGQHADIIIYKKGDSRIEGLQAVYVMMENPSFGGFSQVRISGIPWGQSFIAVNFNPNGQVAYYDGVAIVSHDFATYEYNKWNLLEMEWRADAMARYRINNEPWTSWSLVAEHQSFAGFSYVGLELSGGNSGGVYFDALGVSEPSTIVLLICGLICFNLVRSAILFPSQIVFANSEKNKTHKRVRDILRTLFYLENF